MFLMIEEGSDHFVEMSWEDQISVDEVQAPEHQADKDAERKYDDVEGLVSDRLPLLEEMGVVDEEPAAEVVSYL